jgi:hypothetical protein
MGPFYYAQFPTRCIKCGTSTSRTLPITKLFWRPSTTDRPAYYVIGEVAVMFAQSNAKLRAINTPLSISPPSLAFLSGIGFSCPLPLGEGTGGYIGWWRRSLPPGWGRQLKLEPPARCQV